MTDSAFQVFAKPVGAACNLGCSYCYYSEQPSGGKGNTMPLMPDDLLERYIIQHIESTAESTVFFSWHGGEPLLAGLDFYRKVIEIQKKHLPPDRQLINGIQTNGTLIDEDWCRFLAGERFLVGISIDGPPQLHNIHRKTRAGDDSFERVIRGYRLLQEFGITTELLCVVGSHNSPYPHEVYSYLKSLGAKYITFLPLVSRTSASDCRVTVDSVEPGAWGDFLVTIFDEWIVQDVGNIFIQMFDEAIRTAFDQEHTLCIFKQKCGRVPVIEHNGNFYSCDHYVSPEYYQGNIREQHLGDMLNGRRQKAFGEAKLQSLPGYCRDCEVLHFCNGECPKNRFTQTPDGEPGLNYLCKGYASFFRHVTPFVEEVRRLSGRGNAG